MVRRWDMYASVAITARLERRSDCRLQRHAGRQLRELAQRSASSGRPSASQAARASASSVRRRAPAAPARLEAGGAADRVAQPLGEARRPPRRSRAPARPCPRAPALTARAAVASTDWATSPARSQRSSARASVWSASAWSPRSRRASPASSSDWNATSERPTCSAELEGALEHARRRVEVAVAPEQHAAHRVREAELAGQPLALGERRRRLGLALHRLPVAAVAPRAGRARREARPARAGRRSRAVSSSASP